MCVMNVRSTKTHAAPFNPVPLPDGPWQKVGIDIVGPFESATWDCRYAMTLVDYYTKWPEVAFTPSITTRAITTFLLSVFSRFGNPTDLISDSIYLWVCRILSSERHQAQEGVTVERSNRVLKETLLTAEQQRKPWKLFIQEFLLTCRATPHRTTGVLPHELMFNRRLCTKVYLGPASKSTPLLEKQLRDHVTLKQKA